jgi:hypothetical protein
LVEYNVCVIVDDGMTSGIEVVSDEVTFGGIGVVVVPITIVDVAVGWVDGAVEIHPHTKITRTNPIVRIQMLRISIAYLRQHDKPFNKTHTYSRSVGRSEEWGYTCIPLAMH